MRELFRIDLENYDKDLPKFYRPSSRAIIIKNGKLALVYSIKNNYYKFPGGGIKNDEDKISALTREVKEEVGLAVIKDSVKEFGSVLRIQKGDQNNIFIQENFYYFCDVYDGILNQELDQYEKDALFVLRFVDIDEAIKTNRMFNSNNLLDFVMIKREEKVLKLVKEYLINNRI